jgi:hypothetical protein
VGARSWRGQTLLLGFLSVTALAPAIPVEASLISVQGNVQNPDTTALETYFSFSVAGPSVSGSQAVTGGSASSSVDLPTGKVRAFAAAPVGPLYPNGVPVLTLTATATASLDQTLHIAGAISGVVTGYVVGGIDGALTPSAFFESAFGPPSAYGLVDTVVETALGATVRRDEARTNPCPAPQAFVFCTSGTSFGVNFLAPFSISDQARDVNIEVGLTAFGKGGGIANFNNTLSLGIVLPAGLSFTSDSGAFLTQVPEPAPLALVGMGLAIVGACRRRAAGVPAKPRSRPRRARRVRHSPVASSTRRMNASRAGRFSISAAAPGIVSRPNEPSIP